MRAATAVVHNGSTAGFEAAVAGVPAFSFQAHGERVDWTSNLPGRIAHDDRQPPRGLIEKHHQPEKPAGLVTGPERHRRRR
jgi:hypothetical protein